MKDNERFSSRAFLAARREKAEKQAEERKQEAQRKIPQLSAVYAELGTMLSRLLRLAADGGDDYQEKSEALYEEYKGLIAKKKAYLAAGGFGEDYDLPQYTCKLCNDTGAVDGKTCRCVTEALAKHRYYSSGLGKLLEKQSFDTLDVSYYRGTTSAGYPVHKIMAELVAFCRDYAERFKPGAESLLLIGGAGLGKTHVASSIGKAVIDKGYSVVYESAQGLVDVYEAERFGRSTDGDTERFTACDLLIIDDLGTEFLTQYTVSVLFGVINQRLMDGKSTIITTNLGFAEIESNYKERIYSRLRGEYKPLIFCGEDIRRVKRQENENS